MSHEEFGVYGPPCELLQLGDELEIQVDVSGPTERMSGFQVPHAAENASCRTPPMVRRNPS